MRIAICLQDYYLGGTERFALNLAQALSFAGDEIALLVESEGGGFLAEEAASYRRYGLPEPSAGRLERLRSIRHFYGQFRPEVLIAQDWRHSLLYSLARRFGTRPLIVQVVHNDTSEWKKAEGNGLTRRLRLFARRTLIRLSFRLADATVAVSQELQARLLAAHWANASKLKLIYNPVIGPSFPNGKTAGASCDPRKDGEVSVCTVGWICPRKGFDSFLRAMALLDPSIKATIVGGVPPTCPHHLSELERLRSELGLEARVDFVGARTDAISLMACSDVFVLSSRSEALPTVLIEALALGVPAISTSCPSGPREILNDGEIGLLVPVDDPPALATAINRLLTDQALYRKCAEAGPGRAQDFGFSSAAAAYRDMMRSLLEK